MKTVHPDKRSHVLIPARPFITLVLALSVALAVSAHDMDAQDNLDRPSVVRTQYHDFTTEVWPADFNGDGFTDLVGESTVAYPESSALLMRLGRGDGTFSPPVTIATYSGPPAGVGDVNGDGFIDIVTSGTTIYPFPPTSPSIYPGRGDGTFASAIAVSGQVGAPTEVVDMNNDGRADLVTRSGDQIFVYPGNGDFTFGTRTVLPGGFMVESIITGDVNGDGLLDIASTSKDFQPRISIFLNQGALSFVLQTIPLTDSGGGITVRDMNGDGRLDLIVGAGQYSSTSGQWFSGKVLIFPGRGDGTFGDPLEFATNVGPIRVVAGDFNGDGLPDIATGNSSTRQHCEGIGYLWTSVSVLLGRGDGTLEPPVSFALGDDEQMDRLYKRLRRLHTSDLNADGRTDLISSPGAVLLMGPPAPNRAPVADAGADRELPNDSGVHLQGSATDPDHDWLSFEWRDDLGRVIGDLPNPCLSPYSGTHTFTLTVRDGRGGESSDSVQWTFTNGATMPAYLQGTNVGDTGVPGGEMARLSASVTFEAVGGGADIWGTRDAFRFVHMSVDGNFEVVTQVLRLDNVHPWTKGGLMIRQSLAEDSRHASVFATPTTTNGVAFQRRPFDGGGSVHTSGPATAPIEWLRLVREGDLVSAYSRKSETDTWTFIGNQSLPGLTTTVYVGVAVSSHVHGTAATGLFSDFAVTPLSGGAVPSPDGTELPPATQIVDTQGDVWTLGSGGETLRNGSHAAGGYGLSLLWAGGTLYTFASDNQWWRWTGTGWVAHGPEKPGSGQPPTSPDGTELPPATQVIDASGASWTLGPGGETLRNGVHAGGGYGLSLLWAGGTLYTFASDDQWWRWTGTGWVVYGPAKPPVGGPGDPVWQASDIGNVGAAGHSSIDEDSGPEFTVTGSGADIWGTADAFHFLSREAVGDFDVSARVIVDDVDRWTKAGLMMRETLAANARHAFALQTPRVDPGVAFQRRPVAGGGSVHTAGPATAPPGFLRLVREGDVVRAYHKPSPAEAWTLIDVQTFPGLPPAVRIGFAVTSHADGVLATAYFDNLTLLP